MVRKARPDPSLLREPKVVEAQPAREANTAAFTRWHVASLVFRRLNGETRGTDVQWSCLQAVLTPEPSVIE